MNSLSGDSSAVEVEGSEAVEIFGVSSTSESIFAGLVQSVVGTGLLVVGSIVPDGLRGCKLFSVVVDIVFPINY